MKKKLALFALLSMSFSSQATLVISSELNLTSQAYFEGSQDWDVIVQDSDTQGNTLNSLAVSTPINESRGQQSIQMNSSASAVWNNANSGSFDFNNIGWETTNFDNSGLYNGGIWRYDFVAEEDSVFTLSWDIEADPSNTRTWPLSFQPQWNENSLFGDSVLFDLETLPTDNTWTVDLVAGNEYLVLVSVGANLFGDIGTRTTFADMSFDWNIQRATVVSEPKTLLLLGAPLLGFLLRRRK